MSSVRMCDRDGQIFSERQEGWSTYTGTVRKKDPTTGRFYTDTDTFDACPECTELMNGGQRPELPQAITPHYEQSQAPRHE